MQTLSEEQSYRLGDRLYHADDHAVGQMYYALFAERDVPLKTALGPTQTQFDKILDTPSTVNLDHRAKGEHPCPSLPCLTSTHNRAHSLFLCNRGLLL